jgi:glycosyltransferase involved in cell wall biosynthesis
MDATKPRAWLLSAYRTDSHARWADWLVASQPQFDWERRELPGRFFRWRIRGNPLSWLDELPTGQPDVIVATSMVDLSTLRGLHPRISAVPAIYYFHENQFAYPRSARQVESVDPQMVQLYGALAADRLLFNSAFNRDSFLDGLDCLLAEMPDAVPHGIRQRLSEKSGVCPVAVAPIPAADCRNARLIVWNHRWEYDKAPEVFAEALIALKRRGASFSLALLGPRADPPPAALQQLREVLADNIEFDGRADRPTYRGLLARAGIVVSTALHEFQGLSIIEAASAGARPLVPDALCYPDQYPAQYRYPAGDSAALTERLADWLNHRLPAAVDVSRFHPEAVQPLWQQILDCRGRLPRTPGTA